MKSSSIVIAAYVTKLATARICGPKWGLSGEFLYSYCFVVSFLSVVLFLLFPLFSTLFLFFFFLYVLNPLKAELNPIRHLLALVGARHIVHVSRIRFNS
jgi:hypothetical protein